MTRWRRLLNEVRALFRRGQIEADLERELQSYLEIGADARVRTGASREEAAQQVRVELGSVAAVQDDVRDVGWESALDAVTQDVRFGLRMLRGSPTFTAAAVMTLAAGIGANTAIFSLVNGVLLRPLPYPSPSQLVSLDESKPNFPRGSVSYPNFLDWQHDNQTFSAMAVARNYAFTLTGAGGAERLNAVFVTSDFFPMFGVRAAPGRLFASGEDGIGGAAVALISEGLWQGRFGKAPEVIGKPITLDGHVFTVVGVIPAGADVARARPADVYVPIGQWTNYALRKRGAGLGIHGVGRLKPGVTLEEARADMDRVTRNLAAAFPDDDTGIGASVTPLADDMVGTVRPYLWSLAGAVGLVLLISCVNVGNLLLARSAVRAREFAVRASLGASEGRLVRQVLVESLVLALLGCGFGVLLAWWGTAAALPLLVSALPRVGSIGMDAHVLLFAIGVSTVAGLLFGLAPALRLRRPGLQEALQAGGRGRSSERAKALGKFVVVEVALAFVLLVGAGLMIRTLSALWRIDPGFNAHDVLTFGVSLPPAMRDASPDAVRAALRDVTAILARQPGVRAVSLSWGATPMSGDDEDLFWFDGEPRPVRQSEMKWALSYVVEPAYLQVMGIRLEAGRFFTDADDERAPHVVVIDEEFARKWFSGRNPIGQRLFLDSKGGRAEIVGVVAHVKQWGLDTDDAQALRAQVYVPYMQLSNTDIRLAWSGTGALARMDPSAPASIDSLRQALQRVNRNEALFGAQTMEQVIGATLQRRRFAMMAFTAFAVFAILLASGGIYGVVAYAVVERTPEVAVRLALGARHRDVIRSVVADGLKMTLIGVAAGLVTAMALARVMGTLLYGVGSADPVTFESVAGTVAVVALVACYVPARRAARVDPASVLRG
jgi:predicted permease